METIFYTFQKDLEYLNFNSVKELFENSTKKGAPLFEMDGYSFGCHRCPIFKNNEVIAMDYDFFLMDNNDFNEYHLDIEKDRFDVYYGNFEDFLTNILQEVYERYNIDVWKSLKSHHYYDFAFAYA